MDGMNRWYKLILKCENQRPNKQIKDNNRMNFCGKLFLTSKSQQPDE